MSQSPAPDNNSPEVEEQVEADLSMGQSIVRGVIGLGLFAVITAGLIALTQINTADRIENEIKKARSKALFEIVPLANHNNDMLADAFWIDAKALGLKEYAEAFIAKTDGHAHTLILPAIAPDGYTGPINLIIGINQYGIIEGVRVTSHKETPGLGDKIDIKKDGWITGFNGKSLENTEPKAWKVRKDGGEFDQLTGATITPRAVVNAVHKALVFYKENQVALYQQKPGKQFDSSAISSTSNSAGENNGDK